MRKLLLIVTIFFAITAAIKPDKSGPNFTISPNPVVGQYFDIQFNFKGVKYPNAKLSISSTIGQMVHSQVITSADLSNNYIRVYRSSLRLDNGVYLVQIKSGDQTYTQKLAIR